MNDSFPPHTPFSSIFCSPQACLIARFPLLGNLKEMSSMQATCRLFWTQSTKAVLKSVFLSMGYHLQSVSPLYVAPPWSSRPPLPPCSEVNSTCWRGWLSDSWTYLVLLVVVSQEALHLKYTETWEQWRVERPRDFEQTGVNGGKNTEKQECSQIYSAAMSVETSGWQIQYFFYLIQCGGLQTVFLSMALAKHVRPDKRKILKKFNLLKWEDQDLEEISTQ